ncbi:MAG TPA: MATE family efflux transporter [Steroidobacteraceae bacterium]|nr:MATE family efflux transporter [Steroidobacteraceae bacterium]HQX45979.1 MATE family efflux transporter [Steroidobacteraceae bacterium]HQX79549.1 MATE family efflux transporter [Steroidobacteraceae bacterium]HQZ79052.1 MATE family efflux transporter [Steroidobacteraceae bacterium]
MIGLPAHRVVHGAASVDLRAIARFAAPLMATNAIQALLNLTDTWFIGRLSTDALAAMSAIYWVMTCAILVLGGVGFAVQTFVAQACGSRRRARASQAAWSGLWSTVATWPVFLLLAWAGPSLLAPFHLAPAIEQLALDYWEPRMWGAPLGLATWALTGFFTGVGATRTTFAVAGITVLANVPANQYFMFGLDLGMAGAAWGTNAAQAIGLAFALVIVLSPHYASHFRSRLTWRPNLGQIRRQLKIGLPVGVMFGADVLGVALFQLMIVQTGNSAAAATQVVIMLTSLAYLPAIGIASAGTTFVGQSIGAGDRDWARRVGSTVIAICFGYMACMALLILAGGRWLLPLFVPPVDAEARAAIAVGLLVLWPAATYQAFDGLYFGSASALRGAGDTHVPAITALALSWCFFVPLSHTLVFAPGQGWLDGLPQAGLGALGGWLALMSYAMLLGLSMLVRWRSGRWRAITLARGN